MKFTAAGTVPDSHRIPLLHIPENKKRGKTLQLFLIGSGGGTNVQDFLKVLPPTESSAKHFLVLLFSFLAHIWRATFLILVALFMR